MFICFVQRKRICVFKYIQSNAVWMNFIRCSTYYMDLFNPKTENIQQKRKTVEKAPTITQNNEQQRKMQINNGHNSHFTSRLNQ